MRVCEDNTYFIVGQHGVGKTYLCNKIQEADKGILHLDCGPIIRRIYHESGSKLSFREWEQQNERKYGDDFTEEAIAKELKKSTDHSSARKYIIAGSRSLKHIECFANQFHIKHPKVILIDSTLELQKRNYEQREKRKVTNGEFESLLQRDIEMGLDELKNYVLNNQDTCYILMNYSNDTEQLMKMMQDIMGK